MTAFFNWLRSLFAPKPPVYDFPTPAKPVPPVVPVVPAPILPRPTGGITLGIDVSHYQDTMSPAEWRMAYDLGYRFAYAKCTDGASGVDRMFETHRKNAKAAGMLFGGYHFFRFNDDASAQAVHFLKTLGDITGELPPACDVEWDKQSGRYGEGKEMDKDAGDAVFIFLNTFVNATRGVFPLLYTNFYFWKDQPQWNFKQFPLWISAYNVPLDHVKIPKPWSKATFWQKGEHLTIGKTINIDDNLFLGSLDELKLMVKK